MTDLHELLGTHEFFAGLEHHLILKVADMATIAEFPAGTWIARSGTDANVFHAVIEGRAGVELAAAGRPPLLVATVHPGEVVGWSWYFEPHRWHFDVLALDPLRTVAIDGVRLRVACVDDHELGYHLGRRLAQVVASRLESTRHQLMDVYGPAR
jgi:CRP/FNR family transcriptional regulator, cyclic AMP receptor protein